MEEIKLLREQIDLINEKLVELFERRMELSIKIGEIKKEKGLKVLDSNREREIIERSIILLRNKELSGELEIFLKNIMASSKRIQQKISQE